MFNQKLPVSHRLMHSHEFDAVFGECDIRLSKPSLLFLAKINQRGFNRLGMIVSKKNIPGAVNRNKIKRKIRESFRKLQTKDGRGLDLVILTRQKARFEAELANILNQSFQSITEQMGVKSKL